MIMIRNERLTNTHPVKTLRDIMSSDFLDPTPEQQKVVLIESSVLHKAERFIESCGYCNPAAEVPFDTILDLITGSDPSVTDYLLEQPAKCPKCRHDILEKTLVEAE